MAERVVSDTSETVMEPMIVVVEDDAELRSLLVRGLSEEGLQVTAAGDRASDLLARLPGTTAPPPSSSTSGCPTQTGVTSCRRSVPAAT